MRVSCAADINETSKWGKMDGNLLEGQVKVADITFQYFLTCTSKRVELQKMSRVKHQFIGSNRRL